MKIVKTLFSAHAQHVLAKSHFWPCKFTKSSHWPEILAKTGKQSAFHKNCTKRSFQDMRSTFWPNRSFDRHSSQNRHTGLNFSSKRKNSALFRKIVQNALFRSSGARFGQIAFFTVKVLKIMKLASNSLQNGKTVRFPWKLYKTLFSAHAQHVLAKSHFWAWKFLKSSHWPEILENCTKRSFQDMRSTFWPNRSFDGQSSQNPQIGIIFLQNRKTVRFPWKLCKTLFLGHAQHVLAKSRFWLSKFSKSWNWPQILFKTGKQCAFHEIVQNALFRSCGARFGPIAFLSVKVLKIVTLASNCRKTGKQYAFLENCTKRSFQVMRSTFRPNHIFERQSSQNRHTGFKFSSKRKNNVLSMKVVENAFFSSCAARFGQITFLSVKVLKILTLAWNSRQKRENSALSIKIVQNALFRTCAARFGQIAVLTVKVLKILKLASYFFKTGKQCAFHENCAKRSFQVVRSTFWPNRIFQRQSSQNRHTGLKFSSKRKNSALPMKIIQNAVFSSCAARFAQITFLSVKVLIIVALAWNSRQNGKTEPFL